MPDLSRRVALVTGASRGIGRQTVLALARDGWDVAFTARTLAEGDGTVPQRQGSGMLAVEGSLATTAALVEQAGARALPVQMDLLDLASVRAAATKVLETWGRVDLLVNNAIAHLGHPRLLEADLDDVAGTMTANYLHQLALAQAILPAMVAQGGGMVVNMASGSATADPPGPPDEGGWSLAYSASKAAFGRLAGSINAEFRQHGVRAFNVDPGFVVTESMRVRGGAEEIEASGFPTAPADAAGRVIAWLASTPDADAWLGKVIWSPHLAEKLSDPDVQVRGVAGRPPLRA
jgi:NAD(P)-dependent dehydrogenase (short-subunit alcohol dehydrogenase family)